jgi:hypothetical protein
MFAAFIGSPYEAKLVQVVTMLTSSGGPSL